MILEDIKAIFENSDIIENVVKVNVPEMNKILKEAKIRLQNNKTTAIIFEHSDSSLFQAFSQINNYCQENEETSYQTYSTSNSDTQLPTDHWQQLDKSDFIVVRGYRLANAEKFLKEVFPDVVIVVINQLKDIECIEVRNLLNYCNKNTLLSSIYVVLNDAPDLECVEMENCMKCFPETRQKILNEILPQPSEKVFKVSASKRIDFDNGVTDLDYIESFLNEDFEKLIQVIKTDLDHEFRENRCFDAIVESENLLKTLNEVKNKEEALQKCMEKCSAAMEKNTDKCINEVKEKSSEVLYADLTKINTNANEIIWKAELKIKVEKNVTDIGQNLVNNVKEKLREIPDSDYALNLYLKDHFKPVLLTKNCINDCFDESTVGKLTKDDLLDRVNTYFKKTVEEVGRSFKAFAIRLTAIVSNKLTRLKDSLKSVYEGSSKDFAYGIVKPLQTREIIKNNVLINSKEQDLYKFIDEWTGVNILFKERYDAHLEVNPDMLLTKNDLKSLKSDILEHIKKQFQDIGSGAFGQLEEKLCNIIISKETLMKGDISMINLEIQNNKYYRNEFPIIRRMSLAPDPKLIDLAKSVWTFCKSSMPIERRKSTSEMKQDKSPKRFIKKNEMKLMVTDIFECLSIMPSVIEEICQCVDSFFRNMQN